MAAIPAGLTEAEWNYVPNPKDLCESIRKIDGAELAADIKSSLPSKDLAALQELILTYGEVDETAVQAALDTWNAANLSIMSGTPPGRFITPPQQHHAAPRPRFVRMGTFPTRPAMLGACGQRTLTDDTNATAMVTQMLDASRDAVWCNQMPTTLTTGGYTAVPAEAHFRTFAPAADAAVRDLVAAGLRLIHCISPKNGETLRRVLHGGDPTPHIVVLLVSNGTRLELHVPQTGKPVLVLRPFEHASHALMHSMTEGSRLWLAEGLLTVHAAAASLLGRPPPRTAELLAAVCAVKYVKWYASGAYFEALMKAKLAVFIAVYGVADGTARWQEWYTGRKQHAGASGAPASRGYARAALRTNTRAPAPRTTRAAHTPAVRPFVRGSGPGAARLRPQPCVCAVRSVLQVASAAHS